MTTGKDTSPTVRGTVAAAQITSTASTAGSGDATTMATPIAA